MTEVLGVTWAEVYADGSKTQSRSGSYLTSAKGVAPAHRIAFRSALDDEALLPLVRVLNFRDYAYRSALKFVGLVWRFKYFDLSPGSGTTQHR